MNQEKIKKCFENTCKVKLEIKNGKLFHGGSLDLGGTAITDKSKVNRNINEESFFE